MKNSNTNFTHFFNKTGKVVFLLLFSFFLTFQVNAADFYWVGGTGNWSDFATHWATTSGGAVFQTNAPTAADNVFFDTNSGAAGYTVTLNVAATANNFTFSGNVFSFNGANTLVINGVTTNSSTQAITFGGTSAYTFTGDFIAGNATTTNFTTSQNLSFSNVTIGAGSNFRFAEPPSLATITGTFAPNGTCGNNVNITSTATQANISFTNPQVWNNVNVTSINVTTNNVTVESGTNTTNPGVTNNSTTRTLFWVGNTGNWSDPAHWSLTSGGTGGQCPPTILEDVFFDAASFTIAGQTVTVDVDAVCKDMNWTGVTNTPTFAGAAVREFTLAGSLTFAAGMTQTGNAPTYQGLMIFSSSTPQTITMNGKGFNNVRFQTGAAGEWTLQDAFVVRNQTLLSSGIFNTNGNAVSSGTLSTNNPLTPNRTLNLGTSAITLTSASTTVLDYRNDANFTLNSGTSTITISGANAIVETSVLAKTISNLNFTGTGARVINTGSDVNTITFQNITTSATGTFAINGTSPKTYNTITIGNTVTATINGVASNLGNTVNNNIVIGTGGTTIFNGGYTITGNVTTGAGNTLNFGTAAANNNFGGTVTIGNTGAFLVGGNRNNTFVGNFTLGTSATATLSNVTAGNTNSFSTINMNGGSTFRFNAGATVISTVSGTINVLGSCATPVTLTSNNPPTQARLQLAAALSLVGATVQNINATAQPINVSSGTLANNTNVTGNVTSRNLFWVHSAVGAGSIGNWSDPANWSLTSGGATGECPPTIYDNVRFDDNSFTAAGQIVDMNVDAFCRNMNWEDVTNNPFLQSIGEDQDLYVGGNLTFVAGMTVGTGGTSPNEISNIYFVATEAIPSSPATLNNSINWGIPNENTNGKRFKRAFFDKNAATGNIVTSPVTWTFASAFNLTQEAVTSGAPTYSTGTLRIVDGNLVTANFNIQVRIINANNAVDASLDMGNSIFTLRATNMSVDFRNDANFTFVTPGPNALFDCTVNTTSEVYIGAETKELPDIDWNANTSVNVFTENVNNRITFRNITLDAGVNFTISGTSPKTYSEALVFPDDITASFNGGTTTPNRSIFNESVTFGINSQANFIGEDQFQSTFTVGGTTGTGIRFTGTGRKRFSDDVTLGAGSLFSLQNTSAPPNTFTNVTLGDATIFEFSTNADANVNGNFVAIANCLTPIIIRSSTAGNAATVNFIVAQSWENVLVTDINNIGVTVTVLSGTDGGNNAGIDFSTIALRTLYWVHSAAGAGSTGNWNDPANWSLTSGGITGECPPTLNDDVFFDLNSFSAAGQIVNIDVDAQTRDMTWTGATGTPILQGTNAFTLQMGGSVTLIADMNLTFFGEAIFRNTKTGTNTITSAGQSFKANTTFYDNTLGTGIWQLADGFTTTQTFNLVDGTFTTSASNHQLTAQIIDVFTIANGVGDPTRELNLNGSVTTATLNNGTAVDFRGNTTNFVLSSTATSELHLTGVGNIDMEMGSAAKTIPNLFIDNAGATNTVNINSSGIETNASRITFRNITGLQDNLTFNINEQAPKTYGNITFPNNVIANFNGADNPGVRNLFNGSIIFGQNSNIVWFDNNTFDAPVTIASTINNANAVRHTEDNIFTVNAPLTFSAVGRASWRVGGNGTTNVFQAPVNMLGLPNRVQFDGNDATVSRFESTLFVESAAASQAFVYFISRVWCEDNVTFGEAAGGNATTQVRFERGIDFTLAPAGKLFTTGIDSRFDFLNLNTSIFRDMQIGENNVVTFNADLTVDNMVLSRFDVINFPNSDTVTPALNSGRTVITGFLTARSLLCSEWISIRSNLSTITAEIDFQNAHLDAANRSLLYTFIQDITNTGGNVVEASPDPIVNVSNNFNITFIGATVGTTYYWVENGEGSNSGNWNDLNTGLPGGQLNHWSYTSGGAPSGCIPTPSDIVIFDELSFSSSNDIVTLDNFFSYCKDMIWEDDIFTVSGFEPRLRGDNIHVLQIFGDLRFPNFPTRPDWNEFQGLTQFKGISIPETKTLEFNGSRFFGPVQFDSPVDTWTVVDDMRVEGGGRADITFSYGTVEAGANTISLEDNWVVDVPTGTLPQALFVAQTSTVNFNGNENAQVDVRDFQTGVNCLECSDQSAATSQLRGCSGSPFYNLVVDKRYNRTLELRSTINIYNDFSILVGNVEDDGWQIRGNTTGTVNIADNTRLVLGQDNDATTFPTCYTAANIIIGDGTPDGRMNTSLIPDDPALTTPNLKASIVEYICPDEQLLRGGITYGTLYLRSLGTGNNTKRFTDGDVTINGSFIVENNQLVYDMGYQILGNSFNEGNVFEMRGNSQLILGTNQNLTERTYNITFAQPGLTIPTPVAADIATTFPKFTVGNGTFGDGVFSNTKVSLNVGSTVIYNANADQEVAGGITYGNIILRATGATDLTRKLKTVTRHNLASAGEMTIAGNALVESFNHFIDAGYQITGNATGTFTGQANSKMIIGSQLSGTNFPNLFVRANISLDANDHETIYNADVPQFMSNEPIYGNVTLTAPNSIDAALIEKRFRPDPAGTNAGLTADINGNLVINPRNHLFDEGNQIRGLAPKSVTMNSDAPLGESMLTLGTNGATDRNTQFPLTFGTIILNDLTTVIYNKGSGGGNQTVRGAGLNGVVGGTDSYYNLIIQSGGENSTKTLAAAMRVRNNFIIRTRNIFLENRRQITGSVLATGNMTMEANSELRIGTNDNNVRTVFPTNYERARITLNTTSTVRYQSRRTTATFQQVSSEPIYGNLLLTSGTTGTPNYRFQIAATPVIATNTTLTVNGNLTVDTRIRFEDMGIQIIGNATNNLVVASGSELLLGTATQVTLFPTLYTRANTNLNHLVANKSTVIYNAGIAGSTISAEPNYGNVTLTNAAASGTVTKELLGTTDIYGNLLIQNRNNLDVTASNHQINLGGNWTCETTGSFNSQNGKVVLNGAALQTVTTNAQKFFQLQADNTSGNTNGIRMIDNITIKTGGQTIFNTGLFFPNSAAIKMIFEENATVGGAGTYAAGGWIPITAPVLSADGPSNVSHVVGKVEKQGTDAFMFPIGNGTNYAPAGLSARSSSATSYEARYIGPRFPDTDGYFTAQKEPFVQVVSNLEYWIIDRLSGSTDAAYVYLSWDNPRSAAYQPAGLVVLRWDGAPFSASGLWQDKFNGGYTNASAKGVIASLNPVTDFSPFTLGSLTNFNPLPLDLLSFDAKIEGESVKVAWETTNEIDNSHFNVERSQDGNSFGSLGRVNAKGTGVEGTFNYQFWDAEPYDGLSYYRLKMFDLNGAFKYSPVRSVLFEKVISGIKGEVSLYPNPNGGARFFLNLDGKLTTDAQVEIVDMVGRIVHKQDVQKGGADIVITPMRVLPAGTYILRFVTPQETITKKFVVE